METNDHKGNVCWTRLYKKAPEIRAFHPSFWFAIYKSPCNAPWAKMYFQSWNDWRQEESQWSNVYISWCCNQRNHYRGKQLVDILYHGIFEFVLPKLLLIYIFYQVNVSELGLVTPAGKVVWGKKINLFFFFKNIRST